MKKHLTLILFISITLMSCDKTSSNQKLQKVQKQLESVNATLKECKSENEDYVNLRALEGFRSKDFLEDDLFFNIDLSYTGYQIVHLSSDPTMIPFIIVCEVNSSPSRNGRIINNLSIAIRSTEISNPNPYFKIKGVPVLKKYAGASYDFVLTASIDLNEPTTPRRNMTPSNLVNLGEITRGQTLEIEIDPSELKKSIQELNVANSFLTENQIKEFNDLCCAGVICQGRFVFN